MKDDKLLYLLELVIDSYIERGDPIGSKFLCSLDETDYAPSTIRKYLNLLEKEGLLYQPYNSSGRVPTLKGFEDYVGNIISKEELKTQFDDNFYKDYARNGLRFIVEKLGEKVDGVVVGFLRNDEYYFLGINNLLNENFLSDYETTKHIVKFIEEKKIVLELNNSMLKKGKVNYTFIQSEEKVISCLYIRIEIEGYDGILAVLGPVRINYKKNLIILKNFLSSL